MRLWILRSYLFGQSLFYGFGLLFLVGIIPEWGHWYSVSPFYHAQSEAFMRGELALSHSLSEMEHDLAWSEGGLHQVWGLGVPALRLPLAMLARWCGWGIFPEHVATGLALSGLAFLVLVGLVEPALRQRPGVFPALPSIGAAALLLLFPPFLALLSTHFGVYEEAVAHAYLYGLLEAVLLLQHLRQPSRRRWATLMGVAGLGAFVRPPLVFYGFAAWLLGTLALFRPFQGKGFSLEGVAPEPMAALASGPQGGDASLRLGGRSPWLVTGSPLKTWALGTLLFWSGILALLATNQLRFGSPTEFGHKLNIQFENCNGSLYATRFCHPFETEPLPVVCKELVGALFFAEPHFTADYFKPAAEFWGLAKALRMRDMYSKTYDRTYMLALGGAALLVVWWSCRSFRRRLPPGYGLLMSLGVWSLLSLLPIFGFYLRTPALFSRYLLDLGPGFAVLLAVAWYAVANRLKGRWRMAAALALGLWMGWEMFSARVGSGHPASLDRTEALGRHNFGKPLAQSEAPRIGSQATSPTNRRIPLNGLGWNPETGALLPHVNVFVQNAQFLELELERAPGTLEEPDPAWIRAKIGLEFLARESVVHEGNVWRVRFAGPQRASYRHSIQPAFIIVVPPTRLADKTTPWVLRRVRWRNEPTNSSCLPVPSAPKLPRASGYGTGAFLALRTRLGFSHRVQRSPLVAVASAPKSSSHADDDQGI